MLNIKTHAVCRTGKVKLTNGADEPLLDAAGNQISITVFGPGSREYRKAEAHKSNQLIARLSKKGKATASAAEQDAEQAAFLAACTQSFDGFDYPAPEDKPYTSQTEMFLAAYSDPEIGFIRDQVNEYIRDWANFTDGSATR